MVKWLAYIVWFLIFAPCVSWAKINSHIHVVSNKLTISLYVKELVADTVLGKKLKKQDQAEKIRIKEIAKAKRQPKPEKLELNNADEIKARQKSKRQRRPEGLERPPEIPRRNGN